LTSYKSFRKRAKRSYFYKTRALSDLGVTVIVPSELGHLGLERKIADEEFLVHGVIIMQTRFSGGTTT
jgi:hypothetical protein